MKCVDLDLVETYCLVVMIFCRSCSEVYYIFLQHVPVTEYIEYHYMGMFV